MKLVRPLFCVAITAVCLAGCSSDDPTEPEVDGITVNDLVGGWTASSVLFTNITNPAEQFDLVANGGETRVTVLTGGGARTWVEFGTFSDEWDAQLSISGNTLTSSPVEASRGVRHATFTLVGNTLTLTYANSSFDFTLLDGPEVAATEVVVFVRQ